MGNESYLARIGEDARQVLEAMGRRRRFPARQVLFCEGDDGHEVHVLLDGHVKIVTTAPTGREVILEVLDPGDLLGELSAVDGEPRSATAIALTPVSVLVVRADDFSVFLESHARAAKALLELLVGRLRRSSERQLEFGAQPQGKRRTRIATSATSTFPTCSCARPGDLDLVV